jgi:hypothetical protein
VRARYEMIEPLKGLALAPRRQGWPGGGRGNLADGLPIEIGYCLISTARKSAVADFGQDRDKIRLPIHGKQMQFVRPKTSTKSSQMR